MELKLKEGDLTTADATKKVVIDVLEKARNCPNFGNIGEVANLLKHPVPPDQRSPDVPFEPEDFDQDYKRRERASKNLTKLFEGVSGCEEIVKKLEIW